MKYKLKFEITYPNMDKETIRDLKLDIISTDVVTEVESDFQISPPNKNDEVSLGGVDYIVENIKYSLDKDYYTSIIYIISKIVDQKIKDKIEKDKRDEEFKSYKRYASLLKSSMNSI